MTDSGFPVSVGLELPTVTRTPGAEDLVRFAQGTNDAARLHYDQDDARSRGFPTVIVHGALKATLMSQVLTNWVGLCGWVSDFRAEYRAPDPVGVTLIAHGIVCDVETVARPDLRACMSTSGSRTRMASRQARDVARSYSMPPEH